MSKKMKTMNEYWNTLEGVLPPGMDSSTIKKGFIAGMGAVLNLLRDIADEDMTGEQATEILNTFHQDFMTFAMMEMHGVDLGPKFCDDCDHRDKCDHVGKPHLDVKVVDISALGGDSTGQTRH